MGSQASWERWFQGVPCEDRERAAAEAARLIDRCRSKGQVRAHRYEYRFIRPDGSLIWIESEISADLVGGEPIFRGWVRDITERKRAEEELAASRDRLQNIIDNTPAVIYGFDLEERFILANTALADLLGSTPEKMIGKRRREFMPLEDAERHEANDRKVIETGQALEFEESSHLPDRSITWLTAKFPLRDAQGRIYAVAGISADISQRKQMEEALRELNATLENKVAERTAEVLHQADQLRVLANDLSRTEQRERQRMAKLLHDDIQQLLVAARMQLGLIKRAEPEIIQSTVQGIDAILAETLEASRSLTVELCPPVLHQSGLVAALSWLGARMESKQRFKVHLRADSEAEPANEDERAFLFEALRELLLNAFKHSGVNEARIAMVRTPDGRCKIVCEDKGRGFDPALVETGPSGGFGLFSIQQRLLPLGGDLEIESGPGQGTKAVLTIPIGRPEEAKTALFSPSREDAGRVTLKPKGKRIRVLLVDDHTIMRQGLSSLMQFEDDLEIVAEAENGSQAVEMARRHEPDVIVMDVNMPVMDGIEATRIIAREMPKVKVIGLSMHLESDAANAMREAGAAAFLTKGGPSEDLIAAIRACARQSEKEMETGAGVDRD